MHVIIRLALIGLLVALVAGCSAGAGTADRPEPTVTEPPTVEVTEDPVGNAGVISFGLDYDPDTLEIVDARSRFKTTVKQIAWSAAFSETAGTTTLTIVVGRLSGSSGAEELVISEETAIGSPDYDLLANKLDLASLVGNKAGRYVMRYVREDTVLSEGTFELVK